MIFKGEEIIEITKELKKMLRKEPPMKERVMMRAAIMGYELGAIQQFCVYRLRLNMGADRIGAYEKLAQQGMADLITQCQMTCLELGWDFDEIRLHGLEHLKERHKDFQADGWAEGNVE